jgi:hypothetical protein
VSDRARMMLDMMSEEWEQVSCSSLMPNWAGLYRYLLQSPRKYGQSATLFGGIKPHASVFSFHLREYVFVFEAKLSVLAARFG